MQINPDITAQFTDLSKAFLLTNGSSLPKRQITSALFRIGIPHVVFIKSPNKQIIANANNRGYPILNITRNNKITIHRPG